MKISHVLFLAMFAGMWSGAAAAALTYDMTVLTEPVPSTDGHFGSGISLSADGRTLVVTTSADDHFGQVHIFQRGLHDWKHVQELDGESLVDFAFGTQVLISRDG